MHPQLAAVQEELDPARERAKTSALALSLDLYGNGWDLVERRAAT